MGSPDLNKVADKNREALYTHEKNRSGKLFKRKNSGFNLARNKKSNKLFIAAITISSVISLIIFGYAIAEKYMNYEIKNHQKIIIPSDDQIFLDYMDSGQKNMESHNYEKAIEDFKKVLEVSPDNKQAKNGLIEAQKRLDSQSLEP